MDKRRSGQTRSRSRVIGALTALMLWGCNHQPSDHERTVSVRRERLQEMKQRLDRGDAVSWTDGESIRQMCSDGDYPELQADCAALNSRLPHRPAEPSALDVERQQRREQLRAAKARLDRGEEINSGELLQLRYACTHDDKLRDDCAPLAQVLNGGNPVAVHK